MSDNHDIVVIGTSAGGFDALGKILGQLTPDLPAAIFVVIHLSPDNTGNGVINVLSKKCFLNIKLAENFEHIKKGYVYVAPPDHHMLIKGDHILINRGARENKYRPSVDHLFRSAAANYGGRVIGVILTGMMEDGTSGMAAIKRSGGITVIQDPSDAPFPDMPLSVLGNVEVDYSFKAENLGIYLEELIHKPLGKATKVPDDIKKEAEIAEKIAIGVENPEELGSLSPIVCPDCGGSLWQINEEGFTRFRCHVGHVFTEHTLLRYKSDEVEETIWVVLRMLEERRNLLRMMAEKDKSLHGANYLSLIERAEESKVHIQRLRDILLNFGKFPEYPVDIPTGKNSES